MSESFLFLSVRMRVIYIHTGTVDAVGSTALSTQYGGFEALRVFSHVFCLCALNAQSFLCKFLVHTGAMVWCLVPRMALSVSLSDKVC